MHRQHGTSIQLNLFDEEVSASVQSSTTFADNLRLPIHRWFRYSAGFSARWVSETIRQAIRAQTGLVHVFDPFVGSGTVIVEANNIGVESIGMESHPFVSRITRVKIQMDVEPEGYLAYIRGVLKRAKQIKPSIGHYPPLIRKCYLDDALAELDQLRSAWSETSENPYYEHGWLTLAAILRQCSPVGTASWQYVLPKKTKSKVMAPFAAFRGKASQVYSDLRSQGACPHAGRLLQGDARDIQGIPDGWASLIITSPPYPNNFDYADATRLEMSFFGDVTGWGGLQDGVRKHLVRSCTQHVSPIVRETRMMVESPEVGVIRDELMAVCDRLEVERAGHGGKKNYHTMVAAYFVDMAKVWKQIRRVTAKGGRVCFVIGDSAPYGVYVPVDKWMGQLAIDAGFRSCTFEKTRDRNVKWKNRKHRVPLHEGRLWVEA